jgi:DNA-binding NarL/FixJ family response regulator
MIRVLIVDDHTMFADGVSLLLANETQIEVTGKCTLGGHVMPFLQRTAVDVILLDISLPDISGLEVCRRVREEFPRLKVIALSMFNQASYVTEMIQQGAKGYILKNTGKDELVRAIERVYGGEEFFSREVTETIMRDLMNRKEAENRAQRIPKISRREQEVLALIVNEHTNQEIADVLCLSLKTVESHRSTLLAKLNARNTAGLVKSALAYELV